MTSKCPTTNQVAVLSYTASLEGMQYVSLTQWWIEDFKFQLGLWSKTKKHTE